MKNPPSAFIPLPDPFEEAIRRRAYERYEERGKQDGQELDDWLEAEREVLEAKARAA
jgi:hypothetical protein